MLSNLYGMAYARLSDDLIDEDVDRDRRVVVVGLATALNHEWLRQYIQLFDRDSPFWAYLGAYTAQWLWASEPPLISFRDYTEDDFLRLARRGAPLKLCCAGACLLARREDLLTPLTSAVDYLLIATVLLDDAQDWAADLAAGRYNAFVAYASDLPQTPACREANQRNVLEEIYFGRTVRPYFDVATAYLRRALDATRPVGCIGLDGYLVRLADQVVACGTQMAAEARTRLTAAVEEFQRLALRPTP
jgi:hypothetical protein